MKNATLCFLLRGDEVCLGMKKMGFGKGKWNGFGGKIGDREEIKDETTEEAIRREGLEEFKLTEMKVEKMVEIRFDFLHNPSWDHYVHVYVCRYWEGEPEESDELRPQWFKVSGIPFDLMWNDDRIWLPRILEGEKLRAHFVFGDKENIVEQKLEIINDCRPLRGKETHH